VSGLCEDSLESPLEGREERSIGVGTIFWLGEQKLNDFSVGEAKIGEKNQDNQIQTITLCSMYFSKKVYAVYNRVWGKAPEAGEFS